MNIQPSVMVWTVICFLILTVILKNLLFTPLLKIMDSRREKIQAASKKKEDIEKCHLTCLLRNLYAGQEATVRTEHGTTDWFQIAVVKIYKR